MNPELTLSEFLPQFLHCAVKYVAVLLLLATLLVILHTLLHIPKNIFRKMLHIPAFLSCSLMIRFAESWLPAAATALTIAVLLYPVLSAAEHWKGYAELFVQKAPGEVKHSLLLLFGTAAAEIAVCWGAFARPSAAVAATIMWGVGDAAAALVGRRFGKHKTGLPFADPKKTWEGSLAMAAAELVVGLAVFCWGYRLAVLPALGLCVPTALAGAYTELVSKKGMDTVTVPCANTAVMLLLMALLSLNA